MKMWEKYLLGAPLEYFNLDDRVHVEGSSGEGLHDYVRDLHRRRTTPSGVFGSKLFTADIRAIFEREPEALPLIQADKVIRLRRRRKVEQAISYSMARRSREWIVVDDADRPSDRLDFDFDHVCDSYDMIELQETSWDQILARTEARVLPALFVWGGGV